MYKYKIKGKKVMKDKPHKKETQFKGTDRKI